MIKALMEEEKTLLSKRFAYSGVKSYTCSSKEVKINQPFFESCTRENQHGCL